MSSHKVNGSGIDLRAVKCGFVDRAGSAVDPGFEDGAWGVDLVRGPPGSGKSVLVGSLALDLYRPRESETPPLVALVDMGPGASGLVSLIRESLPEDRRGEARWLEPFVSAEAAINAFDTQLGCRYPLPSERSFLTNFLELLLAPADEAGKNPDEGVVAMIPAIVDRVYRLRDDGTPDQAPRRFVRGVDEKVDAALDRAGAGSGVVLWWDAVDLLFEAGQASVAMRAQRYAVPTLRDVAAAVQAEKLGAAGGGEAAERTWAGLGWVLAELSGKVPSLFEPTAVDTGNARVLAFSLEGLTRSLARDGGERLTGALYMLAWHAATAGWWIGERDLGAIPRRYRDWHMARRAERSRSRKLLVLDHYERPGKSPAVQKQILAVARESRAVRARIAVASSEPVICGEDMSPLATRLWFCGRPDDVARGASTFMGAGGLLSEALPELFSVVDGVDEAKEPWRPWTALRIHRAPGGIAGQALSSEIGPAALWALVGMPHATRLRRRVQERLGTVAGLAALGLAFGGGCAMKRIDAEFAARESGAGNFRVELNDVVETVADEVVAAAGNAWLAAAPQAAAGTRV